MHLSIIQKYRSLLSNNDNENSPNVDDDGDDDVNDGSLCKLLCYTYRLLN